jgi:hypothetical protein
MYLPDVNLWLALTFESHVHHVAAKAWFDKSAEAGCAFCRITQQGFLRIATNPKAFSEEAVTLAVAWRLYDALLSDPRITFADEPAGLEAGWRAYTTRRRFSPKVWNDAYLAAFSRSAGFTLATFDRGFSQYRDLECTTLA